MDIILSCGSDIRDQYIKRWELWRFFDLSMKLRFDGHDVKFVGKNRDELADEITNKVNDLARLLKRADLVVGNDNGIVHIADYYNIKTLMIVGPTNEIKGCTMNGHIIVGSRFCIYKHGCYHGGRIKCEYPPPCLDISVDFVRDKIYRILGFNKVRKKSWESIEEKMN